MTPNAVVEIVPEHLTGVRKAAMLLILVGDKNSAELIKNLTDDEVQNVTREIANLESISSEEAETILGEFYQMTVARDFVVRGGLEFAKKMLIQAFGPEAAKKN